MTIKCLREILYNFDDETEVFAICDDCDVKGYDPIISVEKSESYTAKDDSKEVCLIHF